MRTVTSAIDVCPWFFAASPAAAATLIANAGDDVQAALDAARPGDTIVLEAGATFTGNFVLPPRALATRGSKTAATSRRRAPPSARARPW